MSNAVDEVNKLEFHINKIEGAGMFERGALLMPCLRQLLVVLRALAVSK